MKHLIAMLVFTTATMAAADGTSFTGTWKEDIKRFNNTGMTATYEQRASGMIHYISGVTEYDFRVDGKDYPTLGGLTVAWTKAGENTWDTVRKNGSGAVTSKAHVVISGDGKTKTTTSTATLPNGETDKTTTVSDRLSGGPGLAGTWKTRQVKDSLAEIMVIDMTAPGEISINFPQAKESIKGKCDGSKIARTGPSDPKGAMISLKLLDSRTLEGTNTIEDKIYTISQWKLSADGRTIQETFWVPGHESEKITSAYLRQ